MQVVSLDWLSFSYRCTLSENELAYGIKLSCPKGCVLQEMKGTPQYKKRWYLITDGGEKILTILAEPYSNIIRYDAIFVEVANRWLYYRLDWLEPLLQDIHIGEILGLSRIDIACDFEVGDEEKQIIDDMMQNKIYVAGKKEGVAFYDYEGEEKGVERTPRQLSWGSKKSNIKWKLYNKVLEIYEVDKKGRKYCTKPYIVETWEKAGMNVESVWRLEVSIHGANKYIWNNSTISIKDVIEEQWRNVFYNDMAESRFVTRKNQGHKNRANDERVRLIKGGMLNHRLEEKSPRGEREILAMVPLLRSLVNQMEDVSVMCNKDMRDLVSNAILEVCAKNSLNAYFLLTYGKSPKEFINEHAIN